MIGAVLGAALAFAGVHAIVRLLPADFPRAADIRMDGPVLLFTLLIALATGIVFGIAPALQGSRTDLRETLHETGRSSTTSYRTLRLRNALVISEVSLACVLLIGAGLMIRSFVSLLRADPGFHADHVLTASISLPSATYKDVPAISAFYDRLLTEIRRMPGVVAAGAGSDLPWTGWDENNCGLLLKGETPPANQEFHARYHDATPEYFRALGIPLMRGRMFDEHDRAGAPNVLVINEAMARYWKHGDPLGGKITWEDHPKEKDWFTVVGIVGDVKDHPKNAAAEPAFWWATPQLPFQLAANSSLAIRSTGYPKRLADRLRAAVRRQDPTRALADVRTMDAVANGSYATSRFALVLVALFAALALALAAIGTYGVIAYSVSQRVHEFGIRMALGAKPWDVRRQVVASGMKLAAAGIAFGVLLGIALARLLGTLLYATASADPLAIAGACLLAIVSAAAACYFPAMRATRVDPMTALRAD